MWTQKQAILFAAAVEQWAPEYNCHIALTGGCLYKDGERKDADFLFYRIRQKPRIKVVGLFARLASIGVRVIEDHGFVVKAEWEGKELDFLFPESERTSGDYHDADDTADPADVVLDLLGDLS